MPAFACLTTRLEENILTSQQTRRKDVGFRDLLVFGRCFGVVDH